MIGPLDSFVWGSGGAQLTPTQIDAQRKVAQALMAQGTDYSPVQSWTQGASRVAQAIFGGMQARDANDSAKANMTAEAKVLESLPSLISGQATTSGVGVTPSVSTPMGRTSIPASTNNKIYSNDEPSPLDPPSGVDRQAMVQTILGEAADQGPVGQQAVASVIRNRAVNGGYGGDTPQGVVQAPNQFEPWNTQGGRSRMATAASNPAQAAQAEAAIAAAYGEGGQAPADPTNGATMFYGPKVQAALGRQPPSWENGRGVDIGGHRFFGGTPQTTQVAQADDPAALPPNSQPTQGYAIPGQAQAAPVATVSPSLLRATTDQRFSEGTRKILGAIAIHQMEAAQKQADPAYQADLQLKQGQLSAAPLERRGKELANQKLERELSKSSFEWKPTGKDDNGVITYGFVNENTGEVRDRFNQPIQQQQPAADPNAGLNGEDYLKAIPQDRAELARKVANGELDVALLPNRGNYRMQVLQDAARFDPSFNPTDYKTRLATRKDFTSGTSAKNITSFNTAIGHLDSLDKSVDALGNRSSPLYNKVTGAIEGQYDTKYQSALKDFRTSKQAVADELSRAFKGAGGTVHDISEWEKTINEADSPEALHAATRRAVELLKSRIDAVGDQYNRGMGKTTDPVSLLSPKARSTLERLEGGGGSHNSGASDLKKKYGLD